VATSKAKKQKKRKQAQQRQQHTKQKDHERASHHEHLPKTGTAEDDAYLLRRSREDLLDFGLAKAKKGPLNAILIVGVLLALAAGVLWLIYITR
jgi:hypothetical protein